MLPSLGSWLGHGFKGEGDEEIWLGKEKKEWMKKLRGTDDVIDGSTRGGMERGKGKYGGKQGGSLEERRKSD